MAIRANHSPRYRPVPKLLRQMRDEANLTQRALGKRLRKPQSWIFNCEKAIRRVDLAEYVSWARACGVDPMDAVARYLEA